MTIKRIAQIIAITALSSISVVGCGIMDEPDGSSTAQRPIFDDPAAPCRDVLLDAERANDPAERDDRLESYQSCVDEHMAPEEQVNYEACYEILRAAVRLQPDVDENIIESLHSEYVECVFDYVEGEVTPPAPDECQPLNPEQCYELLDEPNDDGRIDDVNDQQMDRFHMCLEEIRQHNDRCIPESPDSCIDQEIANCEAIFEGNIGADGNIEDDEALWEFFDQCMEQAHHSCDGPGQPQDPNNCEEFLQQAESCQSEDCFTELHYLYEACSDGSDPGDDCIDNGLRTCEEMLNEFGGEGAHDEDIQDWYQACENEVFLSCVEEPGPDQCDWLLRESETCDTEECFLEFHQAFDECLNDGNDPDGWGDSCFEERLQECDELIDIIEDNHGEEDFREAYEECAQYAQEDCYGEPGQPGDDRCEEAEELLNRCIDDEQCREVLENCDSEESCVHELVAHAGIDPELMECFFDAPGEPGEPGEPGDDQCLQERSNDCDFLLDGEGRDGDFEAFEQCIEEVYRDCVGDVPEGPNDVDHCLMEHSNDCDNVLEEGPEAFEQCIQEVSRECHGDQPGQPGDDRDQCLMERSNDCDTFLEDGAPGSDPEAFEQCIQEVYRDCAGDEPGSLTDEEQCYEEQSSQCEERLQDGDEGDEGRESFEQCLQDAEQQCFAP